MEICGKGAEQSERCKRDIHRYGGVTERCDERIVQKKEGEKEVIISNVMKSYRKPYCKMEMYGGMHWQ